MANNGNFWYKKVNNGQLNIPKTNSNELQISNGEGGLTSSPQLIFDETNGLTVGNHINLGSNKIFTNGGLELSNGANIRLNGSNMRFYVSSNNLEFNAINGRDIIVEFGAGNGNQFRIRDNTTNEEILVVDRDTQRTKVLSLLNIGEFTFSTLPIANRGDIAYITDASNINYRNIALGGGNDIALVFYNGNEWIYH